MTKNVSRTALLLLCLCILAGCAQKAGSTSSASVTLETDDQKTLYALGMIVGNNVKSFDLKPEELEIVKAGMSDVVTGAKSRVELDAFGPKVNELHQKRASAGADDAKKKGQEFA